MMGYRSLRPGDADVRNGGEMPDRDSQPVQGQFRERQEPRWWHYVPSPIGPTAMGWGSPVYPRHYNSPMLPLNIGKIRMARSQCNKKNSDILVESGATCFRCIQIWRLYWSWSPRDDWPVIDIVVVVDGSRLLLVNLRLQFRWLNWEIMLPL